MTDPIQADWLLATLEDTRDALDTAIDSLSRHPEEAEEILTEEIAAAYAKLNSARSFGGRRSRGRNPKKTMPAP